MAGRTSSDSVRKISVNFFVKFLCWVENVEEEEEEYMERVEKKWKKEKKVSI